MRPPPRRDWPSERGGGFLLGGRDSWRRVALIGIVGGLVLAAAAALVGALLDGSESGSLDPPPPTPEAIGAAMFEEPWGAYSSTMSPLLPPLLRASRTPSMRIARSTALHMS